MVKNKNSPVQRSQSQRSLHSQSSALNEQLTLLYQLEQRKVLKLEEENRALRERVKNLLTKEDDERIELLVADKTRRKLAQLKAITERTIRSLGSGLKEFHTFVDDIDEALMEQQADGALEPVKASTSPDPFNNERPLQDYKPRLKRIPESPMISMASSSASHSRLNKIEERTFDGTDDEDEDETVEETKMFDRQMDEDDDEEEDTLQDEPKEDDGPGHEGEDGIDEGPREEEEEIPHGTEEGGAEEAEEKRSEVQMEVKEEEEEVEVEHDENEDECMTTTTVNETKLSGASQLNNTKEEEGMNKSAGLVPPSTITFRRTTLRRTAADVVKETPEHQLKSANSTLLKEDTSQYTQFSSTSTHVSTPKSLMNTPSSSGRQKRAAAARVNNYKEPSLNKKMRRGV